MKRGDEASRRRVAKFMVFLSQNQCVANDVTVILAEMDNALSTLWRRSPPRHRIRSALVQRGMIAAIEGKAVAISGVDEPWRTIFTDFPYEPEMSTLMLMHARTREDVASSREGALETASRSMGIRRRQPRRNLDDQKRIETASLFGGGVALDQLRTILANSGDDEAWFLEWLSAGDNRVAFSRSIPGIDAMSELLLQRNRNPNHVSHRNDDEDLSFLRVAIPYANIVVAEKSWGHHARASGVADRYGTVVISDLTSIPAVLPKVLE